MVGMMKLAVLGQGERVREGKDTTLTVLVAFGDGKQRTLKRGADLSEAIAAGKPVTLPVEYEFRSRGSSGQGGRVFVDEVIEVRDLVVWPNVEAYKAQQSKLVF